MRARSAFTLPVLLAAGAPLAAQDFRFQPRLQPEVRAEAAVAARASALILAGANVPMGFYVRSGVTAGAGVTDAPGGPRRALRADVTVRFLLDPFAQARWGPYAGGGLTARREGTDRTRTGLLLILGAEARRGRRWTPAVEFSLGEGMRLALVLRKSRTNGR